jgi:hypothetical protein
MKSLNAIRAISASATIVIGAIYSQAAQAVPAVNLLSAPLVTPSDAWTYYGSATTHSTTAVGWTSADRPAEIRELARALSRGGAVTGAAFASRATEYVRNNIETEFGFGLSKGAVGALVDQHGTPFDQAHLLVEILREGGVTASYNVGTATLTGAQFTAWTGIADARAACSLLADGGIPATVNGATACTGITPGAAISSVAMGHVWVSAAGGVYDPSWKTYIVKNGIALTSALGCGSSCGSSFTAIVPAPTLVSGTTDVYNVVGNGWLGSASTQLQSWSSNPSGAAQRAAAMVAYRASSSA